MVSVRTSSALTAPVKERTQIDAGPAVTSTATKTAVATDGGTVTRAGELAVETINADAAGDDRQNLNGEYIVFSNVGDCELALSGWTVRDEAGKTYTFPEDFVLKAGASVRLHSGSGIDSETELYWGASQPVWNNEGDIVIVETDTGDPVIKEDY